MDFSTYFKLGKEQAELDFVNVDPARDMQLFVDPYAIEIKGDAWSTDCGNHIRSFFEEVLDALRKGNERHAQGLVSQLHEPEETFLGVSKGKPQGRGVGSFQGALILDALRKSVAFKTGLLSDLAEAELFIEGIGRDKISDLTTNVIRGPLIAYTKTQCELHGVPLRMVATAPCWDPSKGAWESKYVELPLIETQPIILVPKFSVRRRLSLESQEFYNHYMIEFLKSEYESRDASLTNVLRRGRRRIYKKDVKQRHPLIKDDLAKFAIEHPEVLERYKKIKSAAGALSNEDLDEEFDEAVFAQVLKARLSEIASGNSAASQYHSFAMGVLTFIFYPDLIRPTKEREIHEGRKRVDILFTNAALDGFFHRMMELPQTRSLYVFAECKNYAQDVGNPELDQLAGRFGHQRGWFGFLVCRTDSQRAVTTKRCRDTAQDKRGFIIVLTDDDIGRMLDFVAAGQRQAISAYLQQRFDELAL